MKTKRFDFDGKNWIWTRADGSRIVLTAEEIQDLSEMSHRAAIMGNPRKGSYILADAEFSY